MKTLVVFYSLGGNTKKIAQTIADAVDGRLLEIRTKKTSPKGGLRYVWAGMQLITKEKPELLPLEADPKDYDFIFLGTPVWAGNFVPAIRSFIKQTKLHNKKIALFVIHGGKPEKTFENLKKELAQNESNNEIVGESGYQMEGVAPGQSDKNLAEAASWAKNLAK